MNMDLNFGGVLGAAAGFFGAGVIMAPSMTPGSYGAFGKTLIGAAVGGAFAGNAVWTRFFKKSEPSGMQSEQDLNNPVDRRAA